MTTAQKNAKAKFKQAIAYRQKTGVSLKEAFAHIYGKKVGSVAKKTVKKKTVKKSATKKVGALNKKYTKKQLELIANEAAYATGGDLDKMTYRLLDSDYTDMLLPKYIKAIKDFNERTNSNLKLPKTIGKLKLKPNEMRLGLLSKKVGATVKKKISKKPSEKAILNKIRIVKKQVNVLDNAQLKHMSGIDDYKNLSLGAKRLYKEISKKGFFKFNSEENILIFLYDEAIKKGQYKKAEYLKELYDIL